MDRSLNGINEPLNVPENNSEETPTKTTLESLRICLFSNHESDGVKKNLDYMRQKYNFTILDIECLINLKGLLAYIAERIQLGKMCLYCGRQFKTAARAQQHMIDKGHCMMPFDKDDEFELFYDFSRAYRDLPQKPMITAGEQSSDQHVNTNEENKLENPMEGNDESDDWEDIDCDDGEMEDVEEVNSDQERSSDTEDQKSSDFVVLSENSSSAKGQEQQPSTSSFSIIKTQAQSSNQNEEEKTESFLQIGDSASSIGNADEARGPASTCSYSSAIQNALKNGKRGKTRQEAFQNLDIKQAELLSTGEIKLPNGKIIGHRDYKHIYR